MTSKNSINQITQQLFEPFLSNPNLSFGFAPMFSDAAHIYHYIRQQKTIYLGIVFCQYFEEIGQKRDKLYAILNKKLTTKKNGVELSKKEKDDLQRDFLLDVLNYIIKYDFTKCWSYFRNKVSGYAVKSEIIDNMSDEDLFRLWAKSAMAIHHMGSFNLQQISITFGALQTEAVSKGEKFDFQGLIQECFHPFLDLITFPYLIHLGINEETINKYIKALVMIYKSFSINTNGFDKKLVEFKKELNAAYIENRDSVKPNHLSLYASIFSRIDSGISDLIEARKGTKDALFNSPFKPPYPAPPKPAWMTRNTEEQDKNKNESDELKEDASVFLDDDK